MAGPQFLILVRMMIILISNSSIKRDHRNNPSSALQIAVSCTRRLLQPLECILWQLNVQVNIYSVTFISEGPRRQKLVMGRVTMGYLDSGPSDSDLVLSRAAAALWQPRQVIIQRRSDAGSWFRDQGEHASVASVATFQQKVGEQFLSWLKNKSLHKLQLKVFNVFSNYSISNYSFSCKLSLFRKCHIATLFCFGNIQRA